MGRESHHGVRPARREKDGDRAQPDFNPSGKLASESLSRNGIPVKYCESSDSAKADRHWRLHVFKNDEQIAVLPIYQLSCYLIGRDSKVADIVVEHESCSKQHAVIQHRQITREAGPGKYESFVRPYLMDLESANGTFLNGERIESCRYYELLPKDLIKFGCSTRDYILLPED